MKRIHILTGTCVALLGAMSATELYFDRITPGGALKPKTIVPALAETREPPHETSPVSADEVVTAYLSGLKEGPEIDRAVAVSALMDRLESAEFAKAPISSEKSDAFVTAAETVLGETTSEGPESQELRHRLAGFIAGRAKGEKAQAFVVKTLTDGPADLRDAVALRVGSPNGVGGKAVYAKVIELGQNGTISPVRLPSTLRRTGGKKAVEPIVTLMRSTDNVKVISACVVALQDFRDPKLLGDALERMEQVGMLDSGSKLPWIGSELLLGYLEKAEGTPLSRGMKALRTRPSLAKHNAAPFERALELGDAETKQIAVEAARKAIVAGVLSSEQGEKLLAGRANVETPAVIKAALPSKQEVKAQ